MLHYVFFQMKDCEESGEIDTAPKHVFCVGGGLLHRNSAKALRGGGESPSY